VNKREEGRSIKEEKPVREPRAPLYDADAQRCVEEVRQQAQRYEQHEDE
jgi:hypothetical protein